MCAEYRISHSHFLGGPPEWGRADRDKAIWWHVRQRGTCQSCGTRPEEWDDEQGGDLNAYHGTVGHCRGCEVQARTQREIDAEPDAYRVGSYATLTRD